MDILWIKRTSLSYIPNLQKCPCNCIILLDLCSIHPNYIASQCFHTFEKNHYFYNFVWSCYAVEIDRRGKKKNKHTVWFFRGVDFSLSASVHSRFIQKYRVFLWHQPQQLTPLSHSSLSFFKLPILCFAFHFRSAVGWWVFRSVCLFQPVKLAVP